VGGRGGIENRDQPVVFDDVEHRRDEHARIQPDRLSGLEEHFHPVLPLEIADQVDQQSHVVVRFGDVMATAEVDPLGFVQPRRKAVFDDGQRSLKRVGAELAQSMEVQALDSPQVGLDQRSLGGAESRSQRAGVVERDIHLGMLGIDAHAEARIGGVLTDDRSKAVDL
jgi:hypothetical protein